MYFVLISLGGETTWFKTVTIFFSDIESTEHHVKNILKMKVENFIDFLLKFVAISCNVSKKQNESLHLFS